MLVGISAPTHYAHTSSAPWGSFLDAAAAALSIGGILCAYVADTQLAAFVEGNKRRREAGKPIVQLLDSGLWRHSRHPNYLGEQMYWWGMALFAVAAGHPEAVWGTILNSFVLLYVTCMTEAKMLREWAPERASLYRQYQRTTSMWLLLPKFG